MLRIIQNLSQEHNTKSIVSIRLVVLTISSLCVLSVLCGSISAQVQPIYDQGAIGLGQLLKRLNNTKRVMHIGAHPDDEDSFLLAYLARGENARTVYLSLTRGDGGQNVIGPELFEPLGIIRSEELLQARTLDGAEQLFTRAFDYGYSKTLAEAKSKWNEKEVLCDAVRAIRSFRPLVVISRFSGTPSDGHGQHQFAGYIAPKAIEAAADEMQCQGSGGKWQVLKFYVGQGFRSTGEPDLNINTGKYDFLLGRSYFEIAAEGRSQHKTQEQGFPELKGDRFSGLNLVWSKVPKVENEKSVFDGIQWTKTSSEEKEFVSIEQSAKSALMNFNLTKTDEIKGDLIKGLKKIRKIRKDIYPLMFGGIDHKRINLDSLLEVKEEEFTKAIKLAMGLQLDALANQETVTNGEEFSTTVKVFYPEDSIIKVKDIKLKIPKGWEVSEGKETEDNSGFARFFRENPRESKTFNIKVACDAKLTQPYFLEEKKSKYLYKWNDEASKNKSFQDALMSADVTVEIDGTEVTFNQPVQYRERDQIRGELRRNLNVVPKVSLKLNQDLLVVSKSGKEQTREVVLSVESNTSSTISGSVDLNLPKGWRLKEDFGIIQLNKKGESTSFAFDVVIPANVKIGSYEIQAVMKSGEETFTKTLNTVAYDHIQTHRYYTKAKTNVSVLDLEVADVKVGYIEGTGDETPNLIKQMGVDIEFLDKKDLTNGDFSKYDLIIVGIRASEARSDYVANNERLLEYVKNGGTMIVQYQKFAFQSEKLAPFPASFNARVAEEDATVTILEPKHSVFNFPNKITQDDFLDWVQERNLYAFKTFDERYTPLLEAHDTGEEENKGGMVYAEIGKGKYMYVSYAFFRQLPAGVPGAYRLYANILSLPKAGK